jgi:pimeloyl-ACP methyl ester carboxylesterase
MSGTLQIAERTIDVWGGRIALRVKTAGRGAPLVYLHPAAGLHFDPFLTALSADYSIFAPELPGTSAGDPNAIHAVDSLSDLVLIYEEAITKLGLSEPPVVIGPSFGGMLAAELAACFPKLFEKVVLCNPIGLWRSDLPIANWMTTAASELPSLLFKNANCQAAKIMFTPPSDPAAAVAALSSMVWALGCTGKFVWPIPEKGLHKRLHRVVAPTLIIWGEDDALIPVGYAREFGSRIARSRVEIVRNAGHIPQAEQMETTLDLVRNFLSSPKTSSLSSVSSAHF